MCESVGTGRCEGIRVMWEGECVSVGSANFCGVNTPTLANVTRHGVGKGCVQSALLSGSRLFPGH